MSIITEYTYAPDRFSHASAACEFSEGLLVALYSGWTECHKSQKVYIYLVGKEVKGPVALEEFTGNPILFSHKDKAYIIYSKFEKFPDRSRALWWQHCSLWQREISVTNGFLQLSDKEQIFIDEDKDNPEPGLGYLPRCNPIWVERPSDDSFVPGKWYLPLYREQNPNFYGTILSSADGKKWEHFGNIGEGTTRCIQPTIWYDDNKFHALLRNFNFRTSKQRFAYYSCTDENDKWSDPVETSIVNANNSLVVLNRSLMTLEDIKLKKPLFVWNNDPVGRDNLSLGEIGGRVLSVIDSYGSYPTICETFDGKLHVLYSTRPNRLKSNAILVIKHKVFDMKNISKTLQT
jgi:hypothetical protein